MSTRRNVAAMSALSLALIACTTNPTTGRRQFNTLSRDDEVKMGTDAKPELTQQYGGEVADPELKQYVTRLGRRLADQTESDYPSLPWEFTLLNSDIINAFALPGGKVFVSRGLAEKLDNEAELAGVMGHECGHVTARHINDAVTRQTAVGVGAAVVGAVVGATSKSQWVQAGAPAAFGVGSQLVLLKFSRTQELEADRLGMRYMTKLNYDPKGQQQVMELLDREAGSNRASEWLSTHPDPKARIQQIQQLLSTEYASTQNNPQFSLHREEFQQQFLARAKKLPPAPKMQQGSAAGVGGGRAFDLSHPATWCAVCAAAEARERAEAGATAP